jgi:hypothetical protein
MVYNGAALAIGTQPRRWEAWITTMKRITTLVLVLLALTLLALAGCDRPLDGNATPEPGAPLLILERTGGIAGLEDKLVIGAGGEYYLSRRGRQDRIGQLSEAQSAQLDEWLQRFGPLTLRFEDNPGGPDSLLHEWVWDGVGQIAASETQQQVMFEWTLNLLDELSRAPDAE